MIIRRYFSVAKRATSQFQTRWFVVLVFFGRLALAQEEAPAPETPADPLADLTSFLCTIYQTLTSTFGVAAALVALAIGCLLWAIGARGALSRIGQMVIAITALISLPTLFFTLFPAAANACATGG